METMYKLSVHIMRERRCYNMTEKASHAVTTMLLLTTIHRIDSNRALWVWSKGQILSPFHYVRLAVSACLNVSVCLSLCLSVYLYSLIIPIYRSSQLSICRSVHPSFHPSNHSPIDRSIHPSIHPSVHPSIRSPLSVRSAHLVGSRSVVWLRSNEEPSMIYLATLLFSMFRMDS